MKQQPLPVPETAAEQQLTTRGLGRRRFLLQAAGVASVAAIAEISVIKQYVGGG